MIRNHLIPGRENNPAGRELEVITFVRNIEVITFVLNA